MKSYRRTCSLLFFLLTLFCLAVLIMGETPLAQILDGIKGRIFENSSKWNPILDERIPRLFVLICTGASLAVSGAVMQSLFQNPLASPSVLGVSSGGSLAIILTFILGLNLYYPYTLPLAAFLGCLLTLCLVYFLSRYQEGKQLTNLVLTGIALSTLLIAIQSLLLYAFRNQWQLIQTITEWESGSSTDRTWQHVHMQLPLTLIGLSVCLLYRKEMNLLTLGDEEAANLGVDVKRVRWRLFLSVSLLTGGTLAAVGVIAFFGLVLPQLLRRLHGPDHRYLIPLCMIGGASAMVFFDLIIRYFSLQFLSLGNLSAIVGGLFFLFLLFKNHQRIAIYQT